MADPVFRAKISPVLSADAQRLVDIYDQTPGSAGPYCNPDGLAAVIDAIAADAAGYSLSAAVPLARIAEELRGASR
jgi:hypothetical protein